MPASTEQTIRELTARLEEAEETLRAVRAGEIDAFIVQAPDGERVYTLRSAEQPYRNLIEDMLEGAAILTTDGDIAYCNKRFAEMVEMPLEEVVGSSMERFVNAPERGAYRSLLGAGIGKRRTQLIAAGGRAVDVLISFTTSTCDEVERRNLIITDLSELLHAQSGRDRAEQQSQAKDEFMAMLAHELRNPLSAITAAVQVLEAGNVPQAAAMRARFIIGRQVQHLSRLVDDLLDVGRVVTGKIVLDKSVLDLADLVRRTAVVFTERGTQHHFTVVTGRQGDAEVASGACARPPSLSGAGASGDAGANAGPASAAAMGAPCLTGANAGPTCVPAVNSTDKVLIEGDAVRIEQIVSNILGNAVKYTPEGGHIIVELSVEGAEAVLRVQDDGLGIAPELQPRIFDLFVQGERTLDRAQGGLGIGLTLVRRLVNLHDGTVSVASEGPNRGSTFTVRFPLFVPTLVAHAQQADVDSYTHAGAANADANGYRIAAGDAGAMVNSPPETLLAASAEVAGDDSRRGAGRVGGSVQSVATAAAEAVSGGDPAHLPYSTPRRRVLIVEDNRDAREMFRMMLELDGHEVLEADEGYAGLKMLATRAPDIAFVDVGLPGLDGYEIARRYRAGLSQTDGSCGVGPTGGDIRPRTLLVALTGYGTPDALERSHRAGFDLHLIKPVNPDALGRVLTSGPGAPLRNPEANPRSGSRIAARRAGSGAKLGEELRGSEGFLSPG